MQHPMIEFQFWSHKFPSGSICLLGVIPWMWMISVLSHCTCCWEVFLLITSLKHRELLLDILWLGGEIIFSKSFVQSGENGAKQFILLKAPLFGSVHICTAQSCSIDFTHRVSHKFFLHLSGLQDGLHYTCWEAYFFLWNRDWKYSLE